MPARKLRIVAIIQARMASTRLPGKTLADVHGKQLLQRVIERSQLSRTIDEVMVATTVEQADDQIAAFCASRGVQYCRGSADDVLDRYYQAAKQAHAQIIVRITADDPFKDPEVLDLIVDRLLADDNLDYVSNTVRPTYPEGLDAEAFTFAALERAWREAKLLSEREHVTPYIWKHPERFRIVNVENHSDLSHMRWTIDYEEDIALAREVYARLDARGMFFMRDILALLEREPELGQLNSGFRRNQGYLSSIEKDQTKR